MRWDRGYNSNNIDDRRGEGPPRAMGFGGMGLGSLLAVAARFGWKGILVAVVIIGAMTYGGNMCSGGSESPRSSQVQNAPTKSGNDDMASFVGFVLDDVQKSFAKQVPGYAPTRLTLFRQGIDSACGTATAAVGPFYCPLDRRVYIDLTFYDELRERFGAPGDFAQAYVIAHEVGHHVQNQKGLLGRGGEVSSVETELQADCLAGAWAKDADARGIVEVGDVDEALNAASQIGDDTIQRKTTGRVQPETWTHGSAAQRSSAFKKGFSGGVNACM